MIKKILGSVFILYGIFFITRVANINDVGSTVPTAGAYMFGQYLSTVGFGIIYLLASIPLFLFDNAYKKSYVEGFRARNKQCATIIVSIIVLAIPSLLMAFSIGTISGKMSVQAESPVAFYLLFLVTFLVAMLPVLVYSMMADTYVYPFLKCKKCFIVNDGIADTYFNACYNSYSEDNSVLANNELLFLPKLYCVIPKSQIKSIEESNQIVYKQVVFHLTNGKKIKIITRQYNNIMRAFNSAN